MSKRVVTTGSFSVLEPAKDPNDIKQRNQKISKFQSNHSTIYVIKQRKKITQVHKPM